MLKSVKIECGNGKKFTCTAAQWGKYTCSFKDKSGTNLNDGNILCPEPRNAIVNGQCCNLGKGCQGTQSSNAILADILHVTNGTTTSPTTSISALLTLAAVCGVVALTAVILGVFILYKRLKIAATTPYSRLP